MHINFFEEYPEKYGVLQKVEDWPLHATVFMMCTSLAEFRVLSARLTEINPNLTPAYWPRLKKSYWVSPFSYTEELEELYDELGSYLSPEKLSVLIDLELPILKPHLFFRNMWSYFKNRQIIERIVSLKSVRCVSAEYGYASGVFGFFPRMMGVSYPKLMHGNRILMFYSSMMTAGIYSVLDNRTRFCNAVAKDLVNDPDLNVGVGTLAVGALGNEPILTPAELRKDLEALQRIGVREVTVFRLGGLTPEHARVLQEFAA